MLRCLLRIPSNLRIFRDSARKMLLARSALECGTWRRFPPATLLAPTGRADPGRKQAFGSESGSKLPHSKSGRLQHRQFFVDVQPLSA